MLTSIEKCKLKFVLDSHVRRGKGRIYEFNPHSFMGELIHKVLENYYKEFYNFNEFDTKWDEALLEFCKKFKIEKEYAQYWVPNYYPKKINTLKTIKNFTLLGGNKVFPEEKVRFKNVRGIIDLFEVDENNVRITDFKTGIIINILDGKNIGVKETYIEQLKTYGYIINKKKEIKADNIELVIKGLGNNELFSFMYSQEEYNIQGLKIDHILNEINEVLNTGNLNNLASPESSICNFCSHKFQCDALHDSIRNQPNKWDRIILLKTINVTFDSDKFAINILVNDRTKSIHNIPEEDFLEIKKMNENNQEVLISHLLQVDSSIIKRWSKLSIYKGI